MNTIESIKQSISALESEMAPVRALADQLAKLQAAATTLAQQEANLAALRQHLAEAEKQEAVRQEAIARYTIVRIKADDHYGKRCAVEYLERYYDSMTGSEAVRPGSLALHCCTPELYWAVLANPEKVPAIIRNLDPDLHTAIGMHARAVGRGWA